MISETTEFIRGTKDDEIFAIAKIIRKGRRIIFAEAEVRCGSIDGDLLSKYLINHGLARVCPIVDSVI